MAGRMPSTTTQRKLATQFMGVTNATRENALQFLKNSNYNLDAAVNQYFSSSDVVDDGFGRGSKQSRDDVLNEMFNALRDAGQDTSANSQQKDDSSDTIGVEAIIQYTTDLNVDMNNYEFFVLCEIVQSEAIGQISRKEFVEGWKSQIDSKGRPLEANVDAHKKYLRSRIDELPRDPAFFKSVYRRAFFAGKEPQQKAIAKEIAIAYWDELFSPALHPWKTAKVDWLDAWKRYLGDNWKRSVNKDMWNQTLEFANRTMEDDTLGFWSEDQAWPGVIDDFVVWCRETGVVSAAKGAEGMEVDE